MAASPLDGPPPAAPDYASAVEAWRVWRVGLRDGAVVLLSLFADAAWEPGRPLDAGCATRRRSRLLPWRVPPNDHPAPELDCSCGIYGVATQEAAREYLDAVRYAPRGRRVLGRVGLWGDMVESEQGWRARHAYPIEILVPLPTIAETSLRRRAQLEEIAFGLEAYAVPVDVVPYASVRPATGA